MMLTGASAPSGDGHRVISFSCQTQQTKIQALAVPSGTPEASQVIAGSCPSGNLVATSSGDAVLYSVDGSGELHRVSLATGDHTSIRAHPDAPSALTGDGLAIKLAPRESAVATVGRDAVLRLWSYPGLERIGSDIATMWTTSYTDCYCSTRSFAPVAWSSDDALLAMSDSAGATVIRRVCDGAIVAMVPDPTSTMRPLYDGTGKWGPTFLTFGPGDQTLAVFYEGSLALYRVRRS
jgi:WD40 repeat protein